MAVKKRGLGRGLDELLSSATANTLQEQAAQAIEQAVSDVLDDGLRTLDILDSDESGLIQVGCKQMGEAVLAKLS